MSVTLVFDHNLVRNVRIRRGLSREEVAESIGITHGVLRNIEAGMRSEPHMRTLRKLAAHYGVEVADFYAEVPTSTPSPITTAAKGVA